MSAISSRKLLGLLLLLSINGALAALAWWQYHQPLPRPTAGQLASVQGESGDELPEPDDYALDDYTETLARPLFLPDRRPLAEEPKKVVKKTVVAKDTTPEVVLIGVIITPASREVLLRWRGASKLQRLALHQRIEGWEVSEIEDDRVSLKKGDDTISAQLDRKRDSGALPNKATARRVSLGGQLYTQGTTR